MTSTLVSTIILSYNTAQLTAKSIQSVLDEYRHSHINGEVIVVDNASSDNSVEFLEKTFKDTITLIKSKTNLGFSKGNNLGISKSSGKYIFLLNSDAFVHPGAIKELLNVFSTYPDRDTAQQEQTNLLDRVGIVSGMLVNQDGSIQKQGGALPSVWTIFLWWLLPLPGAIFPARLSYHIESEEFFTKVQKIGWVGGTAMFIRRELIDEVGNFDESIFMYAEDVELCLRASKHHWDVVYTPHPKITHLGSASSSSSRAVEGEVVGLKYLSQKHFQEAGYQATSLVLQLGTILRRAIFGIISGNADKKNVYKKISNALQNK